METEHTVDEFFFMFLPSKTFRFNLNTAFTLSRLASELDKYPAIITSDGPTVAGARTDCLIKCQEFLDKEKVPNEGKVRALFYDDDIWIDDALNKVVETLKAADEFGLNVIGNYHALWTNNQLRNTLSLPDEKGVPHHATNEQLATMKNLDPLPKGSAGGLGFYYGLVPLDYVFHYDKGLSEDIWMFKDLGIQLHYTDIILKHEKKVWL